MTVNQYRALQALLTCKTREEAAAQAGIAPRTLRSYFEDPEFQKSYKKAFGNLVEDATRQAQQGIRPALDTLHEIMEDPEGNRAVRVSAAKAALQYALCLTEANDIVQELRRLSAGDL